MNTVPIKPEMFEWALERAGVSAARLSKRFSKLEKWISGEANPTLKQLEDFAKATFAPVGYFFLPKPPVEKMPIPDFRTVNNEEIRSPSPDLLDTVYAMQRRQAWLRENFMEYEADPLDFVGAAKISDDPNAIGREMRRILGMGEGWASEVKSWEEAVSKLRKSIEDLGVMAIINGVVENNTHRKLNVEEFRGFALCDKYAPLIFVNGADAKSAQMFTIAHELAHIWLGQEGISGFQNVMPNGTDIEKFCDRAAAEFLVPASELKSIWRNIKDQNQPFETLAKQFKVSPIVAARRALDLHFIDRETFFDFYKNYTKAERSQKKGKSGGDFYRTQNTRVGEFFARQVICAAQEGRVGFREAYHLTGLKAGAFQEYGRKLGFDL